MHGWERARRSKAKLLASSGMYGFSGPAASGFVGPNARPIVDGFTSHVKLEGRALKQGERGLVISSPVILDPTSNRLEIRGGGPDAEELRAGMLFWDRLDWPTNSLFHMAHPDEYEFLINEGVLTRSRAEISGGGAIADAIFDAARNTFAALDARDQGRWTTSRSASSLTIIGDSAAAEQGLNLRLYQAIPVPAGEVPFADVLDFRSKRQAELKALRGTIDEAFLEILAAPDVPFAEVSAVDRIDAAVRDLLACSKENRFRQFLSNIDFSFDWRSAGEAGYATVQQGLPITAAVAGAIGAGIAVGTTIGSLRAKKSQAKSPFEYAVAIHRDLRWTE
jgi:hypothetical protein